MLGTKHLHCRKQASFAFTLKKKVCFPPQKTSSCAFQLQTTNMLCISTAENKHALHFHSRKQVRFAFHCRTQQALHLESRKSMLCILTAENKHALHFHSRKQTCFVFHIGKQACFAFPLQKTSPLCIPLQN